MVDQLTKLAPCDPSVKGPSGILGCCDASFGAPFGRNRVANIGSCFSLRPQMNAYPSSSKRLSYSWCPPFCRWPTAGGSDGKATPPSQLSWLVSFPPNGSEMSGTPRGAGKPGGLSARARGVSREAVSAPLR